MKCTAIALAALALVASSAQAAPALMSAEWTAQACEYWNTNPLLTTRLYEKEWIKNDLGRGYKIVHIYRTDCGIATQVEMKLVAKDNKTICVYGGAVQHPKMEHAADYTMHATTAKWAEWGAGKPSTFLPMKAMMTAALKFQGPKPEAMTVMEPFAEFLVLPGKIPYDKACPTK